MKTGMKAKSHSHIYSFRLDDECLDILAFLAERNRLEKAEVMRLLLFRALKDPQLLSFLDTGESFQEWRKRKHPDKEEDHGR